MKKTKKITKQCGQKNTYESANINLHNSIWSNSTKTFPLSTITLEKSFGDENPVVTVTGSGLNATSPDTILINQVVQYLADASVVLKANGNHFLADSATKLINQIKSNFNI
jgi:hypothetical protein